MHQKQADNRRTLLQTSGLIAGPLLFGLMMTVDISPGRPEVTAMAAVALLMAAWWITEALPLYVTALLPLVLYPFLGIMSGKATAPIYMNNILFLFIGGFMIALAMEQWNLHRRIALWIIRRIGGGPSRLVLGFMAAAAFLSMWISNTATAIMMVPMGLAIILQMENRFGQEESHNLAVGLLLGIAYGCSVGGLATLVGTPPNAAFVKIFQISFSEAEPISFGLWILVGFPLSAVMVLIIWLMLTRLFFRIPAHIKIGSAVVDREYRELGPMSFEEKVVLAAFIITALGWIFRKKIELGFLSIPGWSQWLSHPDLIDDGTIAITVALALFLIPSRSSGAPSAAIMSTRIVKDLPWDIVLLFGGGFALAKGFQETGLTVLIGNKFSMLSGVPPFFMIIIICFFMTFLTEFTSNTATTQMILPILASVSVAMEANPLLLMIPATLSASCAFMMPVATPPNAIIFGAGRIRISEMARAGLLINLIGVMVIAVLFYLIGTAAFAIDPAVFPDWARP